MIKNSKAKFAKIFFKLLPLKKLKKLWTSENYYKPIIDIKDLLQTNFINRYITMNLIYLVSVVIIINKHLLHK